MPHLPAYFARIILSFTPLFVHRSWRHAKALLIGDVSAPVAWEGITRDFSKM